MDVAHQSAGAARIGPNALIQTVRALTELRGRAAAEGLLRATGRAELLEAPPQAMVPESEFVALIGALRAAYGAAAAGEVLARAGELTAAYVLAHRIPAPARLLLPLLPRPLAARLLLRAVAAHAWTFAGAGRFSFRVGRRGAELRLAACPECRGAAAAAPLCRYYSSCFQGLLRPLLSPALTVHEQGCAACGAAACRFAVAWP